MAITPHKNHQIIIAKYDIIRQIEETMLPKWDSQSDISPPRPKTFIEKAAWKEHLCLVCHICRHASLIGSLPDRDEDVSLFGQ